MKPNMHSLWKQITRAADALAYADAGELLPLTEKEAVLGVPPPPPPVPRPEGPKARRQRVALVAEKGIGVAALRYALDVCERLDADLEVLTAGALPDVGRRVELVRQHRDVSYRVVRFGEHFLTQVARYAWNTGGLLFLVATAEDGLAERVASRGNGTLNVPSSVPWVLVTESRNAA